jgi:hypothetical protein
VSLLWKAGHWGQDCRSKAKKEQAFVAQDEESLMVVWVFLSQSLAEAVPPLVTTDGDAEEVMVIQEEKVFLQIGRTEENRDTMVWILDTCAANHMTRSHTTFVDLDMPVCWDLEAEG